MKEVCNLNIFFKITLIIIIFSPSALGIFDNAGYYILQTLICILLLKKQISLWLLRILIFFISIFFLITLSDIFLRFYFKDIFEYRPQDKFFTYCSELRLNKKYKPLSNYKNKTYGDLAAMTGISKYREYRNIIFNTDRYGFRNNDLKINESKHLILLGDSFVEGSGVSQENNISGVLEKKYGYKSYNLGISDFSIWHSCINLKNSFSRINKTDNCKILLFVFMGNDLDDNYPDQFDINELKKNISPLSLKLKSIRDKSLLRKIWRMYFSKKRTAKNVIVKTFLNNKPILFYKYYAERMNRNLNDFKKHKNYKHFLKSFKEIRIFTEKNNISLNVVLIPSKSEVYSWVLNNSSKPWEKINHPSNSSLFISDICIENNFKYFDLTPFLIEKSKYVYENSGELLWWYDDTHFNNTGIEAVCEYLYNNVLLI